MNCELDLHNQMLLEEYHTRMPEYIMLRHAVMQQLDNIVSQVDIELNQMESRIKAEQSLIGKLQRKGHKYQSLSDITDILGVRVIAYYNEDVDRIASMAEKYFDIDWANSVDKRKMHQFDSFGYNSLHYICRIPKTTYYDPSHPELNDIAFELQMRTALQHVWSDIQHGLGYKLDIETPVEYHRALSRLAGMLELADNEFSRIRADITAHRRHVGALLEQGKLEDIPLDGDTFTAYLRQQPFDKLNRYIASINNAEIYAASAMSYLPILRRLASASKTSASYTSSRTAAASAVSSASSTTSTACSPPMPTSLRWSCSRHSASASQRSEMPCPLSFALHYFVIYPFFRNFARD